ncbi:MAG: hypothetical protein AB7E61_01275 [Acholeplasmataceae bacterium]
MKRKILFISVLLLLVVSLVSCKKDEVEVNLIDTPIISIDSNRLSIDNYDETRQYYLYVDQVYQQNIEGNSVYLGSLALVHRTDYEMSVKFIVEGISYESNSLQYTMVKHLDLDATYTYTFNNQDAVVPVVNLNIEEISIPAHEIILTEDDYQYENNLLTINQEVFIHAVYIFVSFSVETTSGYFNLTFNLVDGEIPFVVNSDLILYENDDVFADVYESNYHTVAFSATDLTSTDYRYQQNTLSVNHAFVETFKTNHPSTDYLIILATFTDEESNNYFISIFIKIR